MAAIDSWLNDIADLMLFEKIQQFFEVGTRKHLYLESRSSHAAFPILPQKRHGPHIAALRVRNP